MKLKETLSMHALDAVHLYEDKQKGIPLPQNSIILNENND